MSLITGYGQSLFAPLKQNSIDGKQHSLVATNWRAENTPAATQAHAASLTGAAHGNLQANTLFAAQSIAQDSDVSESPLGTTSAKDDFLAYQQMSTAEKMRAMVLGEMGMTEEELEALPPEEREKIEEKIRARIKELIEEDLLEKQSEALNP